MLGLTIKIYDYKFMPHESVLFKMHKKKLFETAPTFLTHSLVLDLCAFQQHSSECVLYVHSCIYTGHA
jgi:hypothetical protein